nr:response regulator [uncultured Rhodoferax sp.]
MNPLDLLPCPVLVTDHDGRMLSLNNTLLELIGESETHWLQQSMESLFPLSGRIFLQTHVWPMLLVANHVKEIKLQILDQQRNPIPVLVNCQKVDVGGIEHYYWVLFVSLERSRFEAELLEARNRAEANADALRASEKAFKGVSEALLSAQERVRVATESSGIGIWDLDLVSGALFWDAQSYKLYGLEPHNETAAYDLWARHLHPEDKAAAEKAFKDSLATGGDFYSEYRIIWADGSVHHLKGYGRIRFDATGKPVRIFGTNIDVTVAANHATSLKEARDKAEQASQSKGQFVANMSHEIRTPMNAILGMLHLLLSTELTAQQLDYASKTQDAAKALLGLLNDILDFSKVDAGKMTLESEPFGIEPLLRSLSVVLSANVGTKNIEVLYDVDPKLPAVVAGDALRLQQVLINLAGNAIKFTSVGQVVLALRMESATPASVVIGFSVQDSGIGIAEEHQAHIFDGFSQAEASTTRRFGGTGLGLAISKRLVELMGGNLQLTSAPGIGSTFRFSAAFATVSTIPTPLTLPSREPLAPRSVLIVDDNPVAGRIALRAVQSWGWDAVLADSGAQALAMVHAAMQPGQPSFPYPLVFMDWHMASLDGWETTCRLRQISKSCTGPEPIIIMVTAMGRDTLAHRSASEQAMINGFLVKPVTAPVLLEAVHDASLGNFGLRRATRGRNSQRQLANMRILVVEDNLINQQVAEELLTAEGALVSLAANGQIGVEAVAAAVPQFDVVLMDIQMPVLDGYGATRYIRETLKLASLPIIAMTANAMSGDRDACILAGMNEHVGKPFDIAKLVSLLIRTTGFQATKAGAFVFEESLPQPANHPVATELDTTAAIARMAGMQSIYVGAAKEFSKSLVNVIDELQSVLQSTSCENAVRLLHTLKGNAGTLGAQGLYREAARLEALCKSPQGMVECTACLDSLSSLIDSTIVALDEAVLKL